MQLMGDVCPTDEWEHAPSHWMPLRSTWRLWPNHQTYYNKHLAYCSMNVIWNRLVKAGVLWHALDTFLERAWQNINIAIYWARVQSYQDFDSKKTSESQQQKPIDQFTTLHFPENTIYHTWKWYGGRRYLLLRGWTRPAIRFSCYINYE